MNASNESGPGTKARAALPLRGRRIMREGGKAPMTAMTEYAGQDTATRAACLERLATALSGYPDLDPAVRAGGPVPCLVIRNTAAPLMSETVTVSRSGDSLAYTWSWGARINDASDPDSAARAIAYVLAASGARLGR